MLKFRKHNNKSERKNANSRHDFQVSQAIQEALWDAVIGNKIW